MLLSREAVASVCSHTGFQHTFITPSVCPRRSRSLVWGLGVHLLLPHLPPPPFHTPCTHYLGPVAGLCHAALLLHGLAEVPPQTGERGCVGSFFVFVCLAIHVLRGRRYISPTSARTNSIYSRPGLNAKHAHDFLNEITKPQATNKAPSNKSTSDHNKNRGEERKERKRRERQ